jgi:hypothetical protein
MPVGYPPSAACSTCGRDFSGTRWFDAHRLGEYGHQNGHPDGRRCATVEELRAMGLRPMSDERMRASRRHRSRAGWGVEVWHHPDEAERMRAAFRREDA